MRLGGWRGCLGLALLCALATLVPAPVSAATDVAPSHDFTSHWLGYLTIVIFVLAYVLVISEETIHLRKSKPVMLAAGLIWVCVAIVFTQVGDTHTAEGGGAAQLAGVRRALSLPPGRHDLHQHDGRARRCSTCSGPG